MRIWSLHPKYLDSKGLVAVWREGLLALAVLRGNTKGYKKHPQLERFREQTNPVESMQGYLWPIFLEANARGYKFNPVEIQRRKKVRPIRVTAGQLRYELEHLRNKLSKRNPAKYAEIEQLKVPEPHPLFVEIPGEIERWEKQREEF